MLPDFAPAASLIRSEPALPQGALDDFKGHALASPEPNDHERLISLASAVRALGPGEKRWDLLFGEILAHRLPVKASSRSQRLFERLWISSETDLSFMLEMDALEAAPCPQDEAELARMGFAKSSGSPSWTLDMSDESAMNMCAEFRSAHATGDPRPW